MPGIEQLIERMDLGEYAWIYVHLLPTLGFVLALILLTHILRDHHRSPASTMSWLLAIGFVPYLGVPLYLMLGGRKIEHMAQSKPMLPGGGKRPTHAEEENVLISPERHGVFPLTTGNYTALLPTGMEAFNETMRLIESAEHSISIATFILGKDITGRAIVEALARKAAGGVEVRLLLDALGCMKITKGFLAPLSRAGGRFAFFMPMMHLPFRGRSNLRIHRKMLIVDGRAGMMGGMNLAEEYMGPHPVKGRWQDLAISIEGPVAAHLFDIFRSDWKFAFGEDLPAVPAVFREDEGALNVLAQLIASGPDVEEDSLHDAIVTALFKARQRAWVVTPYFVPDEVLIKALCIAARRGVDVRIIVPARSNHKLADLARETYMKELDAAGGRIMLYQPGMLHAKAMILDDNMASIGSANMDMRSLMLNYEVALFAYTPRVIREIDAWMGWLLSQSRPREQKTSRGQDLLYGLGRLLAPLL